MHGYLYCVRGPVVACQKAVSPMGCAPPEARAEVPRAAACSCWTWKVGSFRDLGSPLCIYINTHTYVYMYIYKNMKK